MTIHGGPTTASDDEPEARGRVLAHVGAQTSLPRHVTPSAATTAVMGALMERLTAGEAHELLEAAPPSLQPMLELCMARREARTVEKFDRADLLDRVARELGLTPAHAELVCAAVFEAIRNELPPRLLEDVAHQLPRDIQRLWRAPEASSEAAHVVTQDDAQDVLDEIEGRANLSRGTTAADAFSSVMCALCDRISSGEARDILLGLPDMLRPLIEGSVLHREQPGGVVDREQLLRRIAMELRTDVATAEATARTVFAGVKRLLPQKEVNDVASELPADLLALWESPRG